MTRTKQPKRRRTKQPPKQTKVQKEFPYPGKDKKGHLFAKGNKLWKISVERGLSGQPRKYNPDTLLKGCLEYFEWEDNNTWEHEQLSGSYYGEPIRATMRRMVPYTLHTLCTFLGISTVTWKNYRDNSDYVNVCRYIEQIIRGHKFQGAAAGYFNHAIIARDLGLVDKSDITSKDEKLENPNVIVLPSKEEI